MSATTQAPAPSNVAAGTRPETGRWVFLLLAGTLPLLPLQNVIHRLEAPTRGLPGVNFLNVAILLLLLTWGVKTIAAGRPLLGPTRYNKVLGAYILLGYLGLWRAVSYVGAPLPFSPADPSFVWWKDYMSCFVLYFMVANTVHDERTMRRLTVLMMIGLPYMMLVHRNHLLWASSWHYADDMRVKGTMMHLGSNELASFYVLGLAISMGMLINLKEWRLRLFFLGAAVIQGWGVMYSYSRSGYLAALLAIGVIGLARSWKVAILLGVFLLAAPFILPASVQDRVDMIGGEQTKTDESTRRRIELWDVAKAEFASNPILGTGTRSFTKLNRYGMDTHNMYFKVLCELGLFGFLLYAAQFLVGLRQSWVLLRIKSTPFATGLGAGLLGATAAAMFLNVFGDRSAYVAVTGQFWAWHAMGARILRAQEHEGGWTP